MRRVSLPWSGLVLASIAAAGGVGAACGGGLRTAPAAGKERASGGLHYEVTPADGGARLAVVADVPAGLPAAFHVDQSMTRWLHGLEVEGAGGWVKAPFDGEAWRLGGCERGCRVRYEVDLGAAAREMDDVGYAAEVAGAYLAPPSTWLLHPAASAPGLSFRFRVAPTAGVQFVTGVFPSANGGSPAGAQTTYGADLSDLPESPYSVFGRFERSRLDLAGGTVDVAIVNSPFTGGNTPVSRWLTESARAVSEYYGQFPVPHAAIILLVEDGSDIGYGTTLGNGGGAIVARIGRDTPPDRLARSWMMTHEMLHLAFPNLPRRHRWLEEGMATYIEPIARARVGALTAREVWRGMVKGMFFAQPLPGEGGLDETPTWGRMYWGGALFCLLADVRIRERTGNARSLDDALRGILAKGGNVGARWELERVLRAGDEATGTTVLRELHAEMGPAAVEVDLADLWARLGIRSRGGEMGFDDGAPLAEVRKAITLPSSHTR